MWDANGRRPDREIAAPSNPMPVGREFIAECYECQSELWLRTHKGDFYTYQDGAWPEAEDRRVHSQLWHWLEPKQYMKKVKDGFEATAWEPNIHKVTNVIEAMKAITHLDGNHEAPLWTDKPPLYALDDDGKPLPPGEIVIFDNGLLHVPTRSLLPHTPQFFGHNRSAGSSSCTNSGTTRPRSSVYRKSSAT
jgi:putative DNA primase/helicase